MRNHTRLETVREDGSSCQLNVLRRFIQPRTRGANPGSKLVEVRSYRTDDGRNVRRLGKGLYVCESSGELLTAKDPEAD